MAFRTAMLKCAEVERECTLGAIRRWVHAAPLQTAIDMPSPPLILPEDQNNGVDFPHLPFLGGYMELMAVPKKKVSKHKRGIRNGPRALKPVPVIIRCNVCGRVKLPHFFCCSGIRPNPGE